jgi:hypothetical protein
MVGKSRLLPVGEVGAVEAGSAGAAAGCKGIAAGVSSALACFRDLYLVGRLRPSLPFRAVGSFNLQLGIIASAAQKGTGNLCDYKLTEALDNLEKRFGYDQHSASAHGLTEMLLQDGSVSQAELKPGKAKSKRKKKIPR